jgi:hypothetical protein
MKKLTVLLILCIAFIHSMLAQIGKVGINTTTPSAMLHVKDSSVVFTGANPLPNVPGNPPVSVPGTRMMWYPDKAAFRAGQALGQQWNRDSVGIYSLAIGYDTRAFGENSVAVGNLIKADGHYSVALGTNNITSGQQSSALGSFLTTTGFWSTAIGVSNKSTGQASTAIGASTIASGYYSTSTGRGTIANSLYMFAAGSYNDTTSSGSPFNNISTDPLFVIGNGSQNFSRSNALTILKNGKMGLGTISPQRLLHVSGGVSGATPSSNAVAVFEDNSDMSINLVTTDANSSAIFFKNPLEADGGIAYNSIAPLALDFRTNGNATRAVINDVGNFGIGETTPDARLHVSNGAGGNVYNSNAELIIEDDAASYLQFSNPTTFESGILSGNSLSSLRSAIIFRSDSSVQIRAGGGTTRLHLHADGNVGVGTIAPQRLFHVKNGTGGNAYHGNAELIIEDNDATYLQFSSLTADESGILSGNEVSSLRSAIMFRPDSSIQIRSGGNNTRIMISKSGNIGVGTTTPESKLDVNGTAIIGSNGTALSEIIKATVSKDVASIAAGSSLIVDYTVTNSATTSTVYISPESDLANGLIIAYARVSAAGTVRAKFTNTSTSAIDPPSMNYYITVIR